MIDLRDRNMVREILREYMAMCEAQYQYDGEIEFLEVLRDMCQSAKNNNTDMCDVMYQELDNCIDTFCEENDLCPICFRKLEYRQWKEYHNEFGGGIDWEILGEMYCEKCD